MIVIVIVAVPVVIVIVIAFFLTTWLVHRFACMFEPNK